MEDLEGAGGEGDPMEVLFTSDAEGGEGVVSEEEKHLLRSICSNTLISKDILSYLTFGDMKVASLVSRDFYQMIRSSPKFNSSAVLLFTEKTSQEIGNFYKTPSAHSSRGIKIDVAVPLQILHDINPIWEQIEFLSIITLFRNEKLPPGALTNFFTHVLSSTSNLTHLQIDVRLMHSNLKEALSCPAVQSNLQNLKRFEILIHDETTGRFHSTSDKNDVPSFYRGFFHSHWLQETFPLHDDEEVFSRNLSLLSSLPMNRLESLHITKIDTLRGESNCFLESIPSLLKNSQETLQDLSIHLNAWRSPELRTIRLPRLRRLTAFTNSEDEETLEAFLDNHLAALEELDFGVREKFGRKLFEAITKRCDNVKKLHLKVKELTGYWREKVDWRFLAEMKRLQDFQISRPHCFDIDAQSYGNGPTFLEAIPQSQIQRLSFKGIRDHASFWETQIYDAEREENVEIEPELQFKQELLGNFHNLRSLSFHRCGNAIDDQVIQFIFREMGTLQELHLSHCDNLTDVGIAGNPNDRDSVSIQNLKRLKSLSIRLCPLVTPEGLLSCVRLPYLQALDYLTRDPISKSFVAQIASQNQSLEVITVHLSNMSVDSRLTTEDILKEITHPRLTTLINKNQRSAISEHDSDSDEEENGDEVEMEDDESDISGGGYNYKAGPCLHRDHDDSEDSVDFDLSPNYDYDEDDSDDFDPEDFF